jgi:hypothetical protein
VIGDGGRRTNITAGVRGRSYVCWHTAEAAIQNHRIDPGTSGTQRDADDQGHFTAMFFPGDAPDVEVDYVDLSKARAQRPRRKLVTQ